jgi:hypothetical protein
VVATVEKNEYKKQKGLGIHQVPITTKHPQTRVCHKNKSPAAKQKGLGIHQVPITTNPPLTVLFHKLMLRRVTNCLEESPYKPDTVKETVFKRDFSFARYFCPFLFVTFYSIYSLA